MYEEYRVPSGWNLGNELVALDFWLDEKRSYEARIYWSSSQSNFYFEGKMRERRSRHLYFPNPGWAIIDVGDKDACVKFLNRTLPSYSCPPETLLQLVGKVETWKVAADTAITSRAAISRQTLLDNRPPHVMLKILNKVKKWGDKCLGRL